MSTAKKKTKTKVETIRKGVTLVQIAERYGKNPDYVRAAANRNVAFPEPLKGTLGRARQWDRKEISAFARVIGWKVVSQ